MYLKKQMRFRICHKYKHFFYYLYFCRYFIYTSVVKMDS